MLRKILSSVVAVSFLLNTVSYADVLNVKDRSNSSSNTLAPESRLDPARTPELLDVMKLTAEIVNLTAETKPEIREKATSIDLPNDLFTTTIDKVNASPGVNRDGDHIVFDFRNKVTVNNVTFIYCWINGIPHGGTRSSFRNYLCAAKKIEGEQYDYNFFADASKELDGNDAAKAIRNIELLTGLSIIASSKETKAGVARFVHQQNDTDRLIAKAIIEDKTEVRLDSKNAPYIKEVYDFLRANEFAVNISFNRLVALGQVMEIPGLKTPHAGGIGIYLPKENAQHKNAMTIIHEIFAKCGFSHKEAEDMMVIYNKMTSSTKEALTPDEIALLERAKNADFENRYDDVLKIDFYKSGFNVDPNELTGRDRNWFVGIDSSTQSVKIMVIERLPDNTNRAIWTHTEKFDDPKYDIFGTTGGVLPHPHAPELHHTDPLMLADALDNCMAELSDEFRSSGLDMGNIRAIAGAGQQHGTVYLNTRAQAILRTGLHAAGDSLSAQIRKASILSFQTSPIWQDGTTGEEVTAINKAGGGADSVRKTTGSPATRRFSLAQILANFKRQPSSGRSTDRILNIAGWNGALLTGRADFPIDPGDGLGTNAQMAGTDQWWAGVTDKLIPGLSNKLPPIKPSAHVVDDISSYWVNKYGFSRDTQVVNFTGDNPSGLAGMGVIKEGQVVISLGTSYTAYTFVGKEGLDKALETPIGHIFGETLKGEYMNLVCFHNGDQTLEDIREKLISEQEALARATQAGIEIPQDATGKEALTKKMRIEIFTEELEKTKAGNDGAMAVAMHKTEDVVRIPFDASRPFTRNLDMSNRPQVFRAYVEGQAYFMKWVAEQIGLSFTDIKLTGGVSNNPVVRQIFADVFGANVSVLKEGTEAVALGSAIRAMMAHLKLTPEEAIKDLTEVDSDKTVTPNAANVTKYNKHYKDFEELLGEAIYSGRIQDVKDYHASKTGAEPEIMAIGPGRINLLGEHTDYAGGQVLPIALDGVDVISAASTRTDGMIVVHSPRYGEEYKISVEALKAISPDKMKGMEAIPDESGWARYPLGVIRQMMEISGVNMEKLSKGLTITYDGNVPLGGGLSSSAAVETAVFIAVDGILETGLDKKDASVLCQKAEHWRGNICGIMDQFASMNGVKGKAILLNCNTLKSQPVDISFLETAGYAIVAVDTGLEKTKEAWEKYTARVADLQTAVDSVLKARFPAIQRVLDIAPNLTPEQFESVGGELKALPDGQRIYNRVKHVVEEEARVKKLAVIAAEANALAASVKAGDKSKIGALNAKVEEFGAVISAGHVSLDELYEMSSSYLNQLVKSAKEHGSVGSRFTGAGIVGCTVNIVPKDKLAGFREGVVSEYRAAFADKPTPKVIVSSAGDGARAIDMGKKKNTGGPAIGSGTGIGAGGRVVPVARRTSSVPLKKETIKAVVRKEPVKSQLANEATVKDVDIISAILKKDVIDMIMKAGSGHLGGSLSMVKMVAALYFGRTDGNSIMNYDPKDPSWLNRDRLVLSKGHAAPGLYAALGRAGFFQASEFDTLRKLGSILQGHTDMTKTPGVDMSAGSLGVGISAGVGMALAAKMDGRDYTTYVMLGDGEVEEGQVDEAARHAASMGLDNIVALLDWNGMQIDGKVTDVDVDYEGQVKLWEARGWNAIRADGDDAADIINSIAAAKTAKNGKPSIIIAKTKKGAGLPGMEKHGSLPTAADAESAKKILDEYISRLVDADFNAETYIANVGGKAALENIVKGTIDATNAGTVAVRKKEYSNIIKDDGTQLFINDARKPYPADKKVATRTANGNELVLLGADNTELVVMSADLRGSVMFDKFAMAFGVYSAGNPSGRYIPIGIREAHMVSLAAGLASCGKIPVIGTFSIFTTRMADQLNAILNTKLPVIIVGTHKGLATGPDGRTHQDAHSQAVLGALPRVSLFEGSDAEETMVLSRQMFDSAKERGGIYYITPARLDTPIVEKPEGWQEGAKRGFYVIYDSESGKTEKPGKYDVVIISTGVIALDAIAAAKELAVQGKKVKVINVTQLKAVINEANISEFGRLITGCDHVISAIDALPEILGDKVNRVLVHEHVNPTFVTALGINEFGESGSPAELYALHGFDKAGIVRAALNPSGSSEAGVVPQAVIDFAADMAKLGYKISQDGCAGLEDFVPDAEGGRNFGVFDLIKARVVRAFTTNNSIMLNILKAMAKAVLKPEQFNNRYLGGANIDFGKDAKLSPITGCIIEAINRNPELGRPENKDELLRTVYNSINEVDVAAPLGAALEPIWSETAHRDGYISVEPFTDIVLSGDIERIVSESIAKFSRIQDEIERTTGSRPRNIHIKLPVTEAGLKAGEELIAQGYNLNFTLIATAEQYRAAAKAYKAGARRFVEAAWDRITKSSADNMNWNPVPERIAKFNEYIKANLPQSVASAFVSRDDRNVYDIINDPTFGKLIEHLEFRLKHETDPANKAHIIAKIDTLKEIAEKRHPTLAARMRGIFDSLKVKDADGKDVVGVTKVGVAFTKAVMWPIFQEEFEKDSEWLEFIRQRELPEELMPQQIYLASTGVKIDGKYTTNAFYLENLVASNTTNTIPYPVIYATVKGGKALFMPQVMIDQGVEGAKQTLNDLADVGIDLDLIKNKVIFDEGLKTFGDDDTASLKIIEDALPAAREIAGKVAAAGNIAEAADLSRPASPKVETREPYITIDVVSTSESVQFPEGIDATLIDIAASKAAAEEIVVFVSQDFAASEDKCRQLLPNHPKVKYVPFNQHTQLGDLPGMLSQEQFAGHRKVLITSGLVGEQRASLEKIIASNKDIFRNVIPINAAAGQFANIEQEGSFRKGILSMALLAASMPTDPTTYKQSENYRFLKSLLMKIFNSEREADEYITNLVNPNGAMDVSARFSFLINRVIGPISKLVVNGFTQLVNIFA